MSPAGGEASRSQSEPLWWAIVLALAFAGYFSLLVYCDLTRPEPAGLTFHIQSQAMTVSAVAPASPAAGAGLQVGDRIAAANRRPIHTRLDWLLIETNLETGAPLMLDVARGDARLPLELVLRDAPHAFWLTSGGATVLVARSAQLITLLLALGVIFRRASDRRARTGAWVLATLAVYSIVWPYHLAATWRGLPSVVGALLWIPLTSSLLVAPLTLSFFLIFPRRLVRSRWMWTAIWAPTSLLIIPPLQFMFRAVYRPDQTGGLIDIADVQLAVTTAYTVAALAVLTTGYRRLTDLTERRRVRVLTLGTIVGLLAALPTVIEYWWTSETDLGDVFFASPLAAAGAIVGLAFPLSFSYAILRHRLFDLAFFVRRGLRYALARRVLLSIVPAAAVVFVADLLINRQSPVADILRMRGWSYVVLAGAALFARTRQSVWLDGLDRKFFRERHSAERVLRGISDEVRAAPSLQAVAPAIVVEIEAALHPTFAALMVRDGKYRSLASTPSETELQPISVSSTIVGLLERIRKPIEIPGATRAGLLRRLPQDEREWLDRWGVELVVPLLVGDGAPSGLFVLGPKRSEEPYSEEDEDLLMTIGESLAHLLARDAPLPRETRAFHECPRCGVCYDLDTTVCPADAADLLLVPVSRLLGGRYRLDRRIGRGGMGTVYAALDAALDRHVAIKLLRDDAIEGKTAAERFRIEARLAAALTHPNVVTVHDYGVVAGGRAFLVMELLDGFTLREALQRGGALTRARVVSILRGVGEAVDAAHARQLIHRDLKPENVFLCQRDSSEVPKVLDFGLAKALEATSGTLTASGLVAGTPPYMSPEHRRGEEPSPDWDLWAFAVTAFEMITGELPFAGAFKAESGLMSDRSALLPAPLRLLFVNALSPNPLDRPTGAREFVIDIDRALQDAEPSAASA